MNEHQSANNDDSPGSAGGPSNPSRWKSLSGRVRTALRIVEVRLRMVIVFVIALLVVSQWDVVSNYWNYWTRRPAGEAPLGVSGDTEYFCPMDPAVISSWPSKCPVCNMALVRRKKGSAETLPEGVVSRMQISPYRLQLAGVRTSAVEYRPLACVLVVPALVRTEDGDTSGEQSASRAHVDLPVDTQDAALLVVGQPARITCPARPGQGPWMARVTRIQLTEPKSLEQATVRLEIDNRESQLPPGIEVSIELDIALADMEPFRTQPIGPEPLVDGEPRRVFVCPNHLENMALAEGICPLDGAQRVEQVLADDQRVRYRCPAHPERLIAAAGTTCEECGAELKPSIVTYRPEDKVLAVPETAVIDTGERQLVYVDRGAGMFEGVEVVVGPRADGYRAVVKGLQLGQRVASAGAFLMDAETRLSRHQATAYFGASSAASDAGAAPSAPSTASSDAARITPEMEAAIDKLPPPDRQLARSQRTCPVTRLPLGTMGTPVKLTVGGREVFLCCAACVDKLRDHPEQYLPPEPGPDTSK